MNKSGRSEIHIIVPFARANEIREVLEAKGREVTLWKSFSDCVQSKLSPLREHIVIVGDQVLERSSGSVASTAGVRVIVCQSPNSNQEEYWLRRGCLGILQHDDRAGIVEQCVAALEQDEIWASRRALSRIVKEHIGATAESVLTRREAEIISLVANGRRNQEIASVLCISRETVRWHLRRIYKKRGVHSRKEAAQVLAEHQRECESQQLETSVVLSPSALFIGTPNRTGGIEIRGER